MAAKKPPKTYTTAQKLRDPNKRKLLPISMLTTKQAAERERLGRIAADNNNPLLNPATQLGGHDLATAVRSLVDLQYKPQEAALLRAGSQATTQGNEAARRSAGYFAQLAGRDQQAGERQTAIADRLRAGLEQIRAHAGQQAQDMSAQSQAAQAADAAQRGVNVDPGRSKAEADALAARSAQDAAGYQTAGESAAAAYAGLTQSAAQARQLHGAEVQGQLRNRVLNAQTDTNSKLADLAQQRGNASTKTLLDLRQSGFENLVTQKGLGLKEQDLRLQGLDEAQRRVLARQQLAETKRMNAVRTDDISHDNALADAGERRLTAKEQREADKNDYQLRYGLGPYKRNDPKAKAGAREPASALTLKAGVVNATIDAADLLDGVDSKGRPRNVNRVKEILAGRGAPKIVIQAAIERHNTGITPSTAAALRSLGIRIPDDWYRGKNRRGSGLPGGGHPG